MNGYIKLHRQMVNWGWYKESNTKSVFLHLLLNANLEEKEYKGVRVPVGACVIGRKQLAEDLGMTEQNVRTALEHLKSTNEITITSTNKFSVATIVKWADYQCCGDSSTNKSTNELTFNQPTTNQQLTTPKEYKNIRIKEDIYKGLPVECLELFKEFEQMRKKIKKPMTDRAIKLAITKLGKLSSGDIAIANAIIEQSILHNWQDFYELKEQKSKDRYSYLEDF